MTSLVFPDLNVWLALASRRHMHHSVAQQWLESVEDADLAFCRVTQLGLLRLLTTATVMGVDLLTQRQAWQAYDRLKTDQVHFIEEPPALESRLRQLTNQHASSPKAWADAYLAAFARETGAQLITFDKALASTTHAVLLH